MSKHGHTSEFQWHSRGTLVALSWHSRGTVAALSRHSRGTVAALSRHCGGTLVALSWHSRGTLVALLCRHSRGTLVALSWHSRGTLAALINYNKLYNYCTHEIKIFRILTLSQRFKINENYTDKDRQRSRQNPGSGQNREIYRDSNRDSTIIISNFWKLRISKKLTKLGISLLLTR